MSLGTATSRMRWLASLLVSALLLTASPAAAAPAAGDSPWSGYSSDDCKNFLDRDQAELPPIPGWEEYLERTEPLIELMLELEDVDNALIRLLLQAALWEEVQRIDAEPAILDIKRKRASRQWRLDWARRQHDECLEYVSQDGAEPRRAAEQATDVSRRVFHGEGRFGLQYQEPGLKCQVRDRVLDITLILEADGDASLEFPKWPRAEGLDSKLKGNVLVSKVRCFMEDERRIYTGTWTSNADDTVDAVIDFFLADREPWPVPITVDAKNPAAAGAEYRVPVFGDCPGKKWSAKKTGRDAMKVGNVPPKADSFRCYLFDFVLIEEAG